MKTQELRQNLKQSIDHLSPERLLVAADFLAYLAERESNEATIELSKIPGLLEALQEKRSNSSDRFRRHRIFEILEKIAASNVFANIGDPVEWQRELRQDRLLPGRDE
jgi:hypothetical protein